MTMTLQVILANKDKKLAKAVYTQGTHMASVRRQDVSMNRFAVAKNTGEATALGTSGAGPCQIIVVHKAKGKGALGHYGGTPDPKDIIKGVGAMIAQLDGLPIEAIVLAAGQVAAEQNQQNYKGTILKTLGEGWGRGADVSWYDPPSGYVYDACYYLPLAEQVALFEKGPGDFIGGGEAEYGVTYHFYPPAGSA
jgi:hypothetical protein